MSKSLGERFAERIKKDTGIEVVPVIKRSYAGWNQKAAGAITWSIKVKDFQRFNGKQILELNGYAPVSELIKCKKLAYNNWFHDESIVEVDDDTK